MPPSSSHTSRPLAAGLLLLGLGGCGAEDILLRTGPPLHEPPAGLVLAAPVLLVERLQMEPWEAFHQGYYVGDIWFSGGYEIMAEEDNQVRSVGVDLREVGAWEAQARLQVADSFDRILAERGWAHTDLAEPVDLAVQPPQRREIRGSGPFDGRDNQSLPRFELSPQPLEVSSLPALPAEAHTLLVPLVVHYYSHNGGWFVGQSLGCAAGARMRVLWTLYDTGDGRVLSWGEIGAQHQEPYFYTPNSAQIQDYLVKVEQGLERHLQQQLGR
ncbi:MAG: hypothetical protein ABIO70_08740 [Pseudomonadota bacterium]